jgi:MFS family permease
MVHNHPKRGEIGFLKQLSDLPRSIKFSAFLAFTYVLGWGLVNAFLPLYYQEILGNYSTIGVMMFLFYIFAFCFSFILGGVLDKIKPRRLLMIALLMYLPISFIIINISTTWHFALYVLYHALASTIWWLALESYVRVHSPKNKEMISYGLYDAGIFSSMVIGGVIGGLLIYKLGWNIFYFISIFAFLALIVLAFMPDRKHGKVKDGLKKINLSLFKGEIKDFLNNKKLKKVYTSMFLMKFCYGFIVLMIPLFFKEINASFFMIGAVFGLLYLPAIFEPYYASFQNKKMMVLGGILSVIVIFLIMFFVQSLYALFALTILVAIPFAVILVILQGKITRLMPKKKIGEMTAVLLCVVSLAMGFGPLVAGILADSFGINSMFLLGAGIFGIMFLFNVKQEF